MIHRPAKTCLSIAAMLVAMATVSQARAGLFDDDEARRAILDMRGKQSQSDIERAELAARIKQLTDQVQQLQNGMLQLSNDNQQLRNELAQQRGTFEQMQRDVQSVQDKQNDIAKVVDDRLEPKSVTMDGQQFTVSPDEKRQYDDALNLLRKTDFNGAATALGDFINRYPQSGYAPSAKFWLGNALYGKRDYKGAVSTFRDFVAGSPKHERAPEALLAMANCQLELKDTGSARKTLDQLVRNYPTSEAAQAARERLVSLR